MGQVNYVDVNHEQAIMSLWDAKRDHPEFAGVIAKATQGLKFVDPQFANFRDRCKQANLKFCAYHFLTNDGQAIDQWILFEKTVGDRSDIQFLALDLEQNEKYSDWQSFSPDVCAAKAANWLRVAMGTGHQLALYMDKDYWTNMWPLISSQLPNNGADVLRWVASPSGEPDMPYDLWQWTDQGIAVGGCPLVDCDQFNLNGRLA